jgi:hypothetical protein
VSSPASAGSLHQRDVVVGLDQVPEPGELAHVERVRAAQRREATQVGFGHNEWAPLAPTMKSLADAELLRRRVVRAPERADQTDNPAERQQLMPFVLVGAGPTSCGLAGELSQLFSRTPTEFRHIDPRDAKIILVEAEPRILALLRASRSGERPGRIDRCATLFWVSAATNHPGTSPIGAWSGSWPASHWYRCPL